MMGNQVLDFGGDDKWHQHRIDSRLPPLYPPRGQVSAMGWVMGPVAYLYTHPPRPPVVAVTPSSATSQIYFENVAIGPIHQSCDQLSPLDLDEPLQPRCSQADEEGELNWVDRTYQLCAKFSEFGIGPDLAAMSPLDMWGVYRMLSAMAIKAAA